MARTTQLKVKIKSLAAEAAIIRKEENKLKRSFKWGQAHQKPSSELSTIQHLRQDLHVHRTIDVRIESRSALLAYAYLRNKTYLATEASKYIPDSVVLRVSQIVRKFGTDEVTPTTIRAWIDREVPTVLAA